MALVDDIRKQARKSLRFLFNASKLILNVLSNGFKLILEAIFILGAITTCLVTVIMSWIVNYIDISKYSNLARLHFFTNLTMLDIGRNMSTNQTITVYYHTTSGSGQDYLSSGIHFPPIQSSNPAELDMVELSRGNLSFPGSRIQNPVPASLTYDGMDRQDEGSQTQDPVPAVQANLSLEHEASSSDTCVIPKNICHAMKERLYPGP